MANSWGIDAFYYTGFLFYLITIAQSLNTEELSTQSVEFEDEYGDIFHCVDIYKQPALDHPLLKNHIIQLRPSSIPTDFNVDVSSPNATSQFSVKKRGCPAGRVPIPQTKKGNLLSMFGTTKLVKTTDNGADIGPWWAAYQTKESTYCGGSALISVYGLELGSDQCSLAGIWVENDDGQMNNVVAGWTVCPETLGDTRTRFFIKWTADDYQTTGCTNLDCPGFVQIHKTFTPGSVLGPVSTYAGNQFYLPINIHRDQKTGNWWLNIGENTIGYWPGSLFTSLNNCATTISWGGAALSLGPKPPMGSGHFPDEGFGRAATVKNIQVQTAIGKEVGVQPNELSPSIIFYNCYRVGDPTFEVATDGLQFYFGGPGESDESEGESSETTKVVFGKGKRVPIVLRPKTLHHRQNPAWDILRIQ
ncbi:hypothetical protein QJS10_CPA09g00786 [Acorus calamus]|uniref:Neprosin PEP catalytic domain-containing protein n=1 Tax=Acorus calamus TaxID=4465 RepID=A0AAV9E9P5_ACOCL|nr:hypothetical protein QJS10_CPA09g00786 [Acorus calamus]